MYIYDIEGKKYYERENSFNMWSTRLLYMCIYLYVLYCEVNWCLSFGNKIIYIYSKLTINEVAQQFLHAVHVWFTENLELNKTFI